MEGDVLIAADGIRSSLRRAMLGDASADAVSYSEYTCYTGILDFTPVDLDTVGYRVFLGNGKYFVSSDVGNGKMQWYGFNHEAAGGVDPPGGRKARMMSIFGTWCDAVTDLIENTPEEDVLRRDIYDRPPIFKWVTGRVALLGDSAHAMQPNLGQGGCMAIEDAYCLTNLIATRLTAAGGDPASVDVPALLKEYEAQRVVRCAAIHGLAGMAAIMATTYKAYLGEGLGPIGNALERLQIPHPGRVGGWVAMNATMPYLMKWVLGGNLAALAEERIGCCSIGEKPRAYSLEAFDRFMRDDDSLEAAKRAVLLLQPLQEGQAPIAVYRAATVVGSKPAEGGAVVALPGVSPSHLKVGTLSCIDPCLREAPARRCGGGRASYGTDDWRLDA